MHAHCLPIFYASGAYEDTFAVDSDPNGRFHLIGAGHCGAGVFDCSSRADEQIAGFSGAVRRSVKRWGGPGGVEEAWPLLCAEHHKGGCPTLKLPKGFVAPTPVYRSGVLCTAPTSVLPIPAPSVVSPPPPTSAFNLRPRPPVTPQPGTQTLASPFNLSSASPFTPSTYQWPRAGNAFSSAPLAFPTSPSAARTPLASRASATPRFMSRQMPPSSPPSLPPVSSSPGPAPTASSVLSFASSDLSNLSSSPDSSPRSPRSLSEIEYGCDDDDLFPPPGSLMWAVKGMRHQSWSDPAAAVRAAMDRGMGQMFTLMYSTDPTELEDMHGYAVGIRIGGRFVRDGSVRDGSAGSST
ncbi:hypothetical protein R3P38DRAFT_2759633 [Favolaschia claudopus]|uniref:Uncharacterized protein n=1 Tax=Favolaschia claudopus TaxID=2862362 RepID=A0AAW0E0V7_9AGAR